MGQNQSTPETAINWNGCISYEHRSQRLGLLRNIPELDPVCKESRVDNVCLLYNPDMDINALKPFF